MQEIQVPPRIINGDFAGWLAEAAAARRISLRMLALRADIDHSTISRLARGTREPLLSTALALIRVLDVQPARLIAAADTSKSAPRTAAHDSATPKSIALSVDTLEAWATPR